MELIYDKEIKQKFLDIDSEIKKAEKIILTAHINPDGDAVGAGLAMLITLQNNFKNKKIRMILQDDIPYTTKFLEESEKMEKFNELEEYKPDLLIYLDSATKERTGIIYQKIIAKKIINIDHHISNPEYADINCVVRKASSTSEIIYEFIKYNNYNLLKTAADALYVGLINDTGNFSHSNVNKNTFEMAASLIEKGVNNNYIVTNFLNSNSYQSLKLLGEALKNFEFYPNKKLTYIYISDETMKKYGAKKEDTEGIVEKILSYTDASVALFLRQEENGLIKGSMRSKHDIDVNKIAALFGGGGHIKAAGFSSELNPNKILKIILENL